MVVCVCVCVCVYVDVDHVDRCLRVTQYFKLVYCEVTGSSGMTIWPIVSVV